MASPTCPICGQPMSRNGKNTTGAIAVAERIAMSFLNGINAGFVTMAYNDFIHSDKGSVDDFDWDDRDQIIVGNEGLNQ
jgi:hypothetical protein